MYVGNLLECVSMQEGRDGRWRSENGGREYDATATTAANEPESDHAAQTDALCFARRGGS